jgi:glutathione peroxidase
VRPGNGFVPSFDLTQKVDVNGAFADGTWQKMKRACPAVSDVIASTPWLTSPVTPWDVAWNFESFLIDRTGRPFRRYSTLVDPMSLLPDINQLLSQPAEKQL